MMLPSIPEEEELTPEMIKAGVEAFYSDDWGKEPAESAVSRIFKAMLAARKAVHPRNRPPKSGGRDEE